jgi:hypothetical protein
MNELQRTVGEAIDSAYEDSLDKIVRAVKDAGISRPVPIWLDQDLCNYLAYGPNEMPEEKWADMNLSYDPKKGSLTGKITLKRMHRIYENVEVLDEKDISLRRDRIKDVLAEVPDKRRFLAKFADSVQRDIYAAEVFDLFVEGAKNARKAGHPNKQGVWTFFDFLFKPSFKLTEGKRESARIVFDYSYFPGDGKRVRWQVYPIEGSNSYVCGEVPFSRSISSLVKSLQSELIYDLRAVYRDREHITGKPYDGSMPRDVSDEHLGRYEQQGWEFLEGMLSALRTQVAEKKTTRKRPNEL